MKQYIDPIDSNYLITEYSENCYVRSLIGDPNIMPPNEPLPKNPIVELKEENTKLKDIADKLILDNLNMQIQIDTLITNSLGGV